MTAGSQAGRGGAAGGIVVAVSANAGHALGKPNLAAIRLLADLGVEGDAHLGITVQHRSRVAREPSAPNLRQVHLIHAELHDELRAKGFAVLPGELGENITTRDVDLLALPTDTRLHLAATAIVRVTGLRNPCMQLDGFQPGLMAAPVQYAAHGRNSRAPGRARPYAAAGAALDGAGTQAAGLLGSARQSPATQGDASFPLRGFE